EALAERARAGDADWKALSAQCDEYGTGEIHPPSGAPYPGFPNIGQGYQGDSYYAPMHTLGMCYRVAAEFDPEQAARYAATGTKLLEAMSTPADSGGFQPSTNSGYGIRHYGVAMAIGYDWLYPALSDGVRKRVIDALNTWIDWYDTSGFLR